MCGITGFFFLRRKGEVLEQVTQGLISQHTQAYTHTHTHSLFHLPYNVKIKCAWRIL